MDAIELLINVELNAVAEAGEALQRLALSATGSHAARLLEAEVHLAAAYWGPKFAANCYAS